MSFDEGVFLLLDSGTLRSKDCVTQRFQSYTPSVGVIFSGVPWKSTAAPTFTFTLTAQGREWEHKSLQSFFSLHAAHV